MKLTEEIKNELRILRIQEEIIHSIYTCESVQELIRTKNENG